MENLSNRFVLLKRFFSKEHINDEAGLTPEERLRERQSLETKGLLIELRSLLDSELSKDSEFRIQKPVLYRSPQLPEPVLERDLRLPG